MPTLLVEKALFGYLGEGFIFRMIFPVAVFSVCDAFPGVQPPPSRPPKDRFSPRSNQLEPSQNFSPIASPSSSLFRCDASVSHIVMASTGAKKQLVCAPPLLRSPPCPLVFECVRSNVHPRSLTHLLRNPLHRPSPGKLGWPAPVGSAGAGKGEICILRKMRRSATLSE